MEAMMNEDLSFPTSESLNQDSAIRQFCPARVGQEQGGEWEEMLLDVEEMDMWINEAPPLAPYELEQIVETFFNVECYEKDNANKSSNEEEEENETFDPFQEEGVKDFSIINNLRYGLEVPMIDEGDETEGISPSDEIVSCNSDHVITMGMDQGLQLVHLLLACAEAMGCRDTQLAISILNQIWPCVSPWGDSLQRVSHYFAIGLNSRLSFLQNVSSKGSFTYGAIDVPLFTMEEKGEAFNLLHQTTPYIAFGFMAANDAIFQASMGKDTLHIVDLGMDHNLQWPCLVRNLAARNEGAPKIIRVTGIIEDQDPSRIGNSMERLREEAYSIGIYLEFNLVCEPVSPLVLTRIKLDLRDGEALFVNSILQLHRHVKESRGSLKTLLQSVKKLNPILLTVVEQDANHNGPFFLGRFLESLHYYSAIFDSLEVSLPRNSPERAKIENFHFGEEIRNVVAYEGCERIERHERADQWRRQIGRAGFQVVGLKCLSQAEMMVSGYGSDGYTVACEKGCLLLGWKGRPIMVASAWQSNNISST